MFNSIQHFQQEGTKRLIKFFENYGKDFSKLAEMVYGVTEEVTKLGCSMIAEEWENYDELLRERKDLRRGWHIVRKDETMVTTSLGDVTYSRTLFKNTKTGVSCYLLDKLIGMEPHERLLKAERSLLKLIRENTMFTYLDNELIKEFNPPSTNNRIEGGINARLREMLRNHRGLSIERRIKAVYWWCYMHSPEPLSLSEIINTMPTDKSITAIYRKMNEKQRLEKSLSIWGDAIVWSDLHKMDKTFVEWD